MAYDAGTTELPNNLAAEQAVLGAILYENKNYARAVRFLSTSDFFAPAHAEIWSTISALIEDGRVADGVTLRRLFEQSDVLSKIGGAHYLAETLDAACFGPEIDDYSKIIAEAARQRSLIVSLEGAAQDLRGGGSSADVIDQCRGRLDEIDGDIGESTDDGSVETEDVFRNRAKGALFKTGMTDLDKELKGFEKGIMSGIAGAPSQGKTAIAVQAMVNAAYRGETTAFFSLDMTRYQIWQRVGVCIAFHERRLPPNQLPTFGDINDNRVSEAQLVELDRCVEIGKRHMLVSDASRMKISEIERQVRAWQVMLKNQGRPPLTAIFIDHLGQVDSGVTSNDQYTRTTMTSNKLMAMSKRFTELATVVLVQLNRNARRESRIPMVHDMRDSGAIEEDCHAVALVHNEAFYLRQRLDDPNNTPAQRDEIQDKLDEVGGALHVNIGKNRNGVPTLLKLNAWLGHNAITPWGAD